MDTAVLMLVLAMLAATAGDSMASAGGEFQALVSMLLHLAAGVA